MRELLRQVRVLDPVSQTDRVADVLVEDGIITAISESIPDAPNTETHVYDGQGLILGPGLVDLYSHSGEPGHEDRETLRSLLQSAAAGGFTRVAVLPDTVPAMDNPASVAWLQEQRKQLRPSHLALNAIPQLLALAALTLGVQGQQMTEFGELAAVNVVGFADGKPLSNLLLVRRILEYLNPIQKPVLLWPCDSALTGNGVMREGQDSILFGLPGIPTIAETTALAGLLECIAETGTPVHLMRISTARSVELIRAAKAQGLPITASTTWMHLLLNTQNIASYDPNLRLNPPLGTPKDQEVLLQAVQQGVIDAIAVDHAPYSYEEKTVAFAEAPSGAIGLQLALPLLWQSLVQTQQWSALELWSVLSTQPARCLQQEPAQIAIGQPAEMVLFDPNQTWKVEARSLKSLSLNTYWLGKEVYGEIKKIWC